MALFSLLSINAQSLNSFQKGIDLVNKNINNVSNKDYAKEIAIYGELANYGVSMEEAHRIYNQRYFDRYINENQKYSFYNEISSSLDSIEALFNDIQGSGLSDTFNQYYEALNDIVNEPENLTARNTFLEETKVLVSKFTNIYSSLENEKSNLQQSMANEIETINSLNENLALLNKKIAAQPGNLITEQEQLNSLLNERDSLIKQLSEHVDIKVRYNKNNTVDIFSAKGHALVLFDKSFKLSMQTDSKELGFGLQSFSSKIFINNTEVNNEFNAGTLGAKIETQETIDNTITKLNNLLHEFALQNNAIHTNGVDLNGESGLDIFIDKEGGSTDINLNNIAINPELINNPEKIAAASDPNNLPSDNTNIKNLYDLKEKSFPNLDNRTFYDYYISLVSDIGNTKTRYNNLANDTLQVRDALDNKLQEISGVNLDEELVNLMQLQRSYEAAARVITVTDQLLESVMNIIR